MLLPSSLRLLLLPLLVAAAPAAPGCPAPDARGPDPVLPRTGTGDELPSPPPHLSLKHMALGFGVQNYTCADGDARPVGAGALAVLYDIAVLYPGRAPPSLAVASFANLSTHALRTHRMPLELGPGRDAARPFPPEAPLCLGPNLPPLPFLGHHFFDARGVPTFVLDGDAVVVPTDKLDAVAAPADADSGLDGTGAVGWLRLGARPDARGARYVYRVLTAGGASHGCTGAARHDSASYAANYWFYG